MSMGRVTYCESLGHLCASTGDPVHDISQVKSKECYKLHLSYDFIQNSPESVRQQCTGGGAGCGTRQDFHFLFETHLERQRPAGSFRRREERLTFRKARSLFIELVILWSTCCMRDHPLGPGKRFRQR